MKQNTLTLSYILSYLAIGLSINNHIQLSLIVYFISAALLGLIIFSEKFTFLFKKPLLLALTCIQIVTFVFYYKELLNISCSFLITMVFHSLYSLLFFVTVSSIEQKEKVAVNKTVSIMICLLISALVITQLVFFFNGSVCSILKGYWGCCLIISYLPLTTALSSLGQIVQNKAINI